MRAKVNERSVIKANSQFWEQMLAMTLEPVPSPAPFHAQSGHLLGSVALSGVWTGQVEVRLEQKLAYHSTGAMLLQAAESVSEADVLDATREIANMIAGSLKSCLPQPCEMSVPEAAAQIAEYDRQPDTKDDLTVVFRHAAGDMMIRLSEQDCLQQG
jgi:hypothetical protein